MRRYSVLRIIRVLARRRAQKLIARALDTARALPKSAWSKLKAIRPLIREATQGFFATALMPLYPLAIFVVLLYLFTSPSRSGIIRRVEITEDHPVVVRVARGRRTAIHFWVKPEKVIPGSPNKIQIDFLGNDIAVSPQFSDPGNLLVYAHGSRFVILFQMAQESNYDDVVLLRPAVSHSLRAIRLDQDTYRLGAFQGSVKQSGHAHEINAAAILKDGGRIAVFDDLGGTDGVKKFVCKGCVFSRADSTFACHQPIEKIECQGSDGFRLSLKKVMP